MPTRYDDLWTAAKGMYKMEPVVADGGEVIIYAPHVSEVSYTHGRLLTRSAITAATSLSNNGIDTSYPPGILRTPPTCAVRPYDERTGIDRCASG